MEDAPLKLESGPVRFTLKDVVSLGTIAVLIALQWGFNTARIAAAEDRVKVVEDNDRIQTREATDIKGKVIAIEKDTQQLIKQQERQERTLDEILKELRSKK